MKKITITSKCNKFEIIKKISEDLLYNHFELEKDLIYIDAGYLLYLIPDHIKELSLNNINMEFNKVLIKTLANVKALTLNNKQYKRNHKFNQNQIKAFLLIFPSIEYLQLCNIPFDFYMIKEFSKFAYLKKLYLFEFPLLSNESLNIISKQNSIVQLGLGGSPNQYNNYLNFIGFQSFEESQIDLKIIKLRFITDVGDRIIQYLCQRFINLVELQVIRNSFQECEKITDIAFTGIKRCTKLQNLSIIYSRDFSYNIPFILVDSLTNIKKLCLRACPIFQDLTALKKLIYLQQLDMSGDSWIRPSSLAGISKHPNLKIFYLGHFDHGETNCEQIADHYPPQGIFIQNIFKNCLLFPKLQLIYLQQCCVLTFWLDIRIKKIRPQLEIKYRKKQQFE